MAATAGDRYQATNRITLAFILTGLFALLIGSSLGPLQALEAAGIDLYPFLKPLIHSYYEGLTLHGVFNAYFFTTFFISGLLLILPARNLDLPARPVLGWASFGLMLLGLVLTGIAILGGGSSVLYSFYAPLQADALFYIGLALVVVASWLVALNVFLLWRRWKRAHPGQVTPLVAYMSLVTWIMWVIASLGIAVEVVAFLIPWSLGWVSAVDPTLTRTLFWFTGHPIVYFWVMPAYISWYALLPRECGGKLVSDPLARLAFLFLLAFSTPVGMHHQYTDAGLTAGTKLFTMILTLTVAYPSLLTAFTVGASLETGAKLRGGKGMFRWFLRLPWKNPSVAGQLLAMVSFIFGGAGGVALASYSIDYVVHNTMFIPGHFHITVGTATALSFLAISNWLIPHLTKRRLWSARIALWQVWFWFAGMMTMAIGLHWAGLLGAPRRTPLAQAMQAVPHPEWQLPLALAGVAGVILSVALVLYFYNLIMTLFVSPRLAADEVPEIPFAEAISTPADRPSVRLFERLGLWVGATLVLIAVAYGPALWHLAQELAPQVGIHV